MSKLLVALLKLLAIPVFFCLVFVLSAFFSYFGSYLLMEKKGMAAIHDPRIPNAVYADIIRTLRPFQSVHDTTYEHPQTVSAQYGLTQTVNCYLQSEDDKSSRLYQFLKKSQTFVPPIEWSHQQLPNGGFYDGKDCFAFYINPDQGVSLTRLSESAVFAEMLIRKVMGDRLVQRRDFYPSEHVKALPFEGDSRFLEYDASIFGIWSGVDQMIYVSSSSPLAKEDIGQRLMHEMHHSFASEDFSPAHLPGGYTVPNEMLAEYLRDYVANHSGRETPDYTPAIKPLLKYLDEEDLVNAFYNGRTEDIRDIVDAKTYPGAFCTYLFYVNFLEPYGHEESDLYEKALLGTNPSDKSAKYKDCLG